MSKVKLPTLNELIAHTGSLDDAINYLLAFSTPEDIHRRYNIPFHYILLIAAGYKIKNQVTFKTIVDYFKEISSMQSIKGKRSAVANYLHDLQLPYEMKIRFITGSISDEHYGVSDITILEALRLIENITLTEASKFKLDYGEIGDIASVILRRAKRDIQKPLLADEVFYTLKLLPSIGRNRKILSIMSLLARASPDEGKFLCRLLKKNLHLGLPTRSLVHTVAKYVRVIPELLNNATLLKGTVPGLLLAPRGNRFLEQIKIQPGQFIDLQLCFQFERNRIRCPAQVEVKYDGSRIEIHKRLHNIWLYSRRGILKNKAYPEILEIAKNIRGNSWILDGEIIGYDDNNNIVSFEKILKRTGKKSYDEITGKEIHLTVKLFDCLYYNKPLIHESLEHRQEILYELVDPEYIALGKECINYEEIMKFYDYVVSAGYEGIICKDKRSQYHPGRRHPSWLKLKHARDSLDVVITKAKYGRGTLSGLFSSFRVAVRHPTKKLLFEIGDVGGIDRDTLEYLTDIIKPFLTNKRDKEGIICKPGLIIEVLAFEIIPSDVYSSGYAMRNPKFVRVRPDLKIKDIDTIYKIQKLAKR